MSKEQRTWLLSTNHSDAICDFICSLTSYNRQQWIAEYSFMLKMLAIKSSLRKVKVLRFFRPLFAKHWFIFYRVIWRFW